MPPRTSHLFRRLSFCLLVALAAANAADETPAELAPLRAAYDRDVDFAVRPIRDRYLFRLDALKKNLGARGDARGAIAIQEEIDRIKESSSGGIGGSKFAGAWTIRYETGTVRKYTINGDDIVTVLEENDKPVPKLHAKLVPSGNDALLDFGEGKIERLRINNNVLSVEHYFPKSTYPSGPPLTRGTGTRTVSK